MRIITFLLVTTFSLNAFSVSTGGVVERIFPTKSTTGTAGNVSFRLIGDPCTSESHNTYWTFSLDTEASKAWFAMLLSAAVTKTKVIVGAGACDKTVSSNIWYLYQNFNE